MKKILILLFFIISSCGYKPVYQINNQLIQEFNKIILNGDNKINRQIVNSLNLKQKNNSDFVLKLETNYNIDQTSKNSKGQVTTFRSTIRTKLLIEKNKDKIKDELITVEFSYNNKENKFELTEYQKEIKNNLTNKLIEEIIIYLSLK